MCGIAGVHRFGSTHIPRLNEFLNELLLGIEHRGQDATGYGYVCDDGDARVQKASLAAKEFIQHRGQVPVDARTVILHTRFATNGAPEFPENNHPTIAGSVLAVHNGVIWNDDKLFTEVDTPRMGQVDSEIIPAMTNKFGFENLELWVDRVEGSFALAIADMMRPGELALVRGHHSPLYVYRTNKLVVWASTYLTIKNAWAKCFGTPPSDKSVELLKEGTTLYYNVLGENTPESFSFEPATAWASAYTSRVSSWDDDEYGWSGTGVRSCEVGKTAKSSADVFTGQNTWEVKDGGWMVRCGICDSYCDDDDVSYVEEMWICEDCQMYVLNYPSHAATYGKIADAVLAAETEHDDDDDESTSVVVYDDAGVGHVVLDA